MENFKVDGYLIPISFDTNHDSKLQVSELNIWCKANDLKYENGKIKNCIPYDAQNAPKKFCKDKYSLKNLEKRYPKDRYDISVIGDGWLIEVTKKGEECSFLSVMIGEKITYVTWRIGENETSCTYDGLGKLEAASSKINGQQKFYSPLADKLHKDISAKNSFGLPTTGKDISSHIEAIEVSNVNETLGAYYQKYGKSLISDIFQEYGLDASERANYAKHIVDAYCPESYFDDIKKALYEEIDYQQRKTGFMDSSKIDKMIASLSMYRCDSAALASELYKDVSEKKTFGIPTTRKSISKNVQKIERYNVYEVMQEYSKQNNGASLLSDIITEWGLKSDTRKAYITHIVNAYLEYAEVYGIDVKDLRTKFYNVIKYQMDKIGFANPDYLNDYIFQLETKVGIHLPNGKIDQNFKQGNTGDCWLLASIKAILNNPEGAKILNNSIKKNDDGSVSVTLNGVNRTYVIPEAQLHDKGNLANGDGDVRAIEIAVNNYFKEKGSVNGEDDIDDGNLSWVAFNILLGAPVFQNTSEQFSDGFMELLNKTNVIATVSSHGENKETIILNSGKNTTDKLVQNHAYAFLRADSEYVYLSNPWDADKEIKITRELFKQFFDFCQGVEL